MQKKHGSKIGRNKLLTLAIAATLLVSAISIGIPIASAAEHKTVSAGTGQGSIFYSAHRIPDSHWDPCFAESCDQGTGPGTWIWFVLFNDAGEVVTLSDNLANEDGILITGLDVGRTYYLQPTDCEDPNCGPPPHDVRFNNWDDCSTNPQKPFLITTNTRSAAAYYRYHLHGEPDEPVACYTSSSPSTPPDSTTQPSDSTPPDSTTQPSDSNPPNQNQQNNANSGGATTSGVSFWDNAGARAELMTMIERAELIKLTMLQTADNGTSMITGNATEIAAASPYSSFNELVENEHPGRVATAMMAAEFSGINFNGLPEQEQMKLVLTLLYGSPTGETNIAAEIPDIILSGHPLGENGIIVEYKSFYDIVNSHAREVALVMREVEMSGGDFESLSDTQKSYLVLTKTYGEPQ